MTTDLNLYWPMYKTGLMNINAFPLCTVCHEHQQSLKQQPFISVQFHQPTEELKPQI